MTHDITHCKGLDCPIKESCKRYQAHKEVVEGKYTEPVTYFIDYLLCGRAREAKQKIENK